MDKERILLVDDEERIRDMIKEYTSLEGYDIDEASNGLEALELFKQHKYSLIILDVILVTSDFIFSIMSFDPRANFENLLSGKVITVGALSVMSFFVLIALFFDRPFCNYLCYEGAKYGLMSSLKFFTIRRDKSICVNCKKCDKVCPMNIKVSKCSNLRSPQCINCFQCVCSSPVKVTISYGKLNMTNSEK